MTGLRSLQYCCEVHDQVRGIMYHTMEKRIQRAFEQINKLNESINIEIAWNTIN